MPRKKRVKSLETGIATLGPAPELSTTPVVRSNEGVSLSPAVVTYRRVLAEMCTPILPLPQSATRVFPAALVPAETHITVTANSSDAHPREVLPADLSAVLRFARHPVVAMALKDDALPAGITRLMQIAAGSSDAMQQAVCLTGKDPAYLRAAIIFYLEKTLWTEPRDAYRVLGATADTPRDDLVERVRLLVAWLHPYIGGVGPEALFAERVLRAWVAVQVQAPAARRSVPQDLIDQGTGAARASVYAQPARTMRSDGSVPASRNTRRRRVRWSVAVAALFGLCALVAVAGSGRASPLLHQTGVEGFVQGKSVTSDVMAKSSIPAPQ